VSAPVPPPASFVRRCRNMGIGKLLILAGIVLVGLGILWIIGTKLGQGRLPGDVVVRGENSTFYFPIVTCILLSVLLTLVLWLVRWWQS
jgi:hypothetical protein